MSSVNRVILVGNLGRDAEIRATASGDSVASFSLATTEVRRDRSGEKDERTEWHRVSLWGKQADAIGRYLVKGKQIYLEGRLQTRKAPRCRECDAFIPERDVRVEAGRAAEAVQCPKCGKKTTPYLETQVDIRADRVALLGSAGGGMGQSRGGVPERPEGYSVREPVDVPEDDIPF